LFPGRVIYLINEFLIDYGGEGFVKSSLKSFGSFVGDFDGSLQKTQWEVIVGFTGYPESEFRIP